MISFRDLDLNDPDTIRGILDHSIAPHEVPQLSVPVGSGHTPESFQNSAVDLLNKGRQYKAGGQLDYRFFQTANDPEKPYSRTHHGNPNATLEIEQAPGIAIMQYDPKDPVAVAAAGRSDSYQDAFAKDAGFKDRRSMMKELKQTNGWHVSSLTPLVRGQLAKGAVPNKHKLVIFHKKGFKIDNGGPPMLGTNEVRRDYQRELRKRNRDARDA